MKIAVALILPLAAYCQMQDNRGFELACQDAGYNRQVHRCDVREQSFPSPGRISANPGRNGGVTVKGWLRNDVLVRARIEAWGDTEAEATALMNQIRIDTSGGAISSSGPADSQIQRWAVSFEIFVPRITNVNATAFNGGIHMSDVEGAIEVETNNGGIHLARMAGDVKGTTKNGGIHVELAGSAWQGRQLELKTTNGGVTLSMPDPYSAHLQAETANGRIHSDFAIAVTGAIRPRTLDANLGSGGPLIHVSTVNGGVHVRRG